MHEAELPEKPNSPSAIQVMGAVSAAQISRYNMETIIQAENLFQTTIQKLTLQGQELNAYFIELKFDDIPDMKKRGILKNMATSFSLPDDQVDMLYESGRTLLKTSEEFQRLLRNLKSNRQ